MVAGLWGDHGERMWKRREPVRQVSPSGARTRTAQGLGVLPGPVRPGSEHSRPGEEPGKSQKYWPETRGKGRPQGEEDT